MAGVFKAYDIRGLSPGEINKELAYKLGVAFQQVFNPTTVFVGYDARTTSPELFSALVLGLTSMGVEVIDGGLCSTPLFYYASKNYDGAIMITASHNPPEYNGFKITLRGGKILSYENGIKELEAFIKEWDDLSVKEAQALIEPGAVIKREYLDEFLNFSLSFLNPFPEDVKEVRIAVDAGNGMSGLEFSKLHEKSEGRIVVEGLYMDPDGNFPNHEANPIKEDTLIELKELIKDPAKGPFLFGIATDGDGDRAVFIDEKGETVRPDLLLAIISKWLLIERPGRKVLYDICASRVVPEVIEKSGGIPVMTRVGHSYIKELLAKEDGLIGGEVSGHYYPGDTGGFENPLYMTAQLINLLLSTGSSLSELAAPLKKYSYSGNINIRLDEEVSGDDIINGLKDAFSDGKINELDGLRVDYDDWWFLVRKSNTEPLVRLIIEAENDEALENKKRLLEDKIEELKKIKKG